MLVARLAPAQLLEPAATLNSQSEDVGFEFRDILRVAYQEQDPDLSFPNRDSVESPADESLPCTENVCPQCHCATCNCAETPHPCEECPRVNNINPAWGLKIGGTISLDAFYNSARPVAPGTPFFLTPKGPFNDATFDIHARETTIYLAGSGPRVGDFESGALVMFALYNDSITVDRYGFLPFQALGDLKNEEWRFAGGLQLDIFAPVIPTVLPYSILAASGNTGMFRGQLRAERYLHPAEDQQITITSGISDPNPTILIDEVLSEDNGWPNIEVRAAWGVGKITQEGLVARRPFEVGVSGVVGQVRSTDLGPVNRVVADVWGLAADYRWRISERWGFQGEVFTGQGLGTYGGDVLQTVNSTTFEAIAGTGGWIEVYYYCTPCVHTHWGYGIDDPVNADVAPTQVDKNDTAFANVIWDVTQSFRLASEFTYRTTDYLALPDNEGFGYQWQMQWKF